MQTFTAPHRLLEKKPAHGSPCNKCGLCCMATVCKLGQAVFGRSEYPGPCPGLVLENGDEYSCAVLQAPWNYISSVKRRDVLDHKLTLKELADAAALIIGAGDGCDARFNGEWVNKEFHKSMAIQDAVNADKLEEARRLWGIFI